MREDIIDKVRAAGVVGAGGAGFPTQIADRDTNGTINLFELEDFYPAGDEFILDNEVTGKVVPEGGIPLHVMTVVNNIESLLNVSRAMVGKPVTERCLTVCGEVQQPLICKVPIGTPVGDIIQLAGGVKIYDYGIVMGGPMMGKVISSEAEPVTKTTSGIKRESKRENYQVSMFNDTRKIPLQRLMQRLEVVKYDTHPPFCDEDIQINQVRIPLQQHLGQAAEPVVKPGEHVRSGDLLGEIPEGALGARVHASIDGVVESVGNAVVIKN